MRRGESRAGRGRGMAFDLDFSRPFHRAIGAAGCIATSVAVSTSLDPDPQKAAVLAFSGALAGLATNVASSLLDGHLDHRLRKKLQAVPNHDLTRAVGQAVGTVIRRAAADPGL